MTWSFKITYNNRYKDFIMLFQNTVKQLSTFSKMIKRLRLFHYARVNILKYDTLI